ncbi:MAG TPA: EAL domain-containing protein [Methylibium sp.]|uniref:putative bifunctional diguanylate cyclase/phosphodiesterase n=1 Tax=Methylibium sp. TaxID=2067992 RepID=UPI002DB5A272|nr:EAL domain-containing protein [Methylibium sp.]HEU4458742.1 EAL domain-containing protein [Methylibium sp.]
MSSLPFEAPTDAAAVLAPATLLRWADALPALLACYDADTRACVYANARHAALLGDTNLAELEAGRGRRAELARGIVDAIERLRAGAASARFEAPLAHGEGRSAWAEFELQPERDADGQLRRCLVFAVDVTRHAAAERALRESEERLAKFMQASLEGIVFHKGGFIVDANEAALDLLGHRLDEVLGRPTLDFVAPDEAEHVATVLRAGVDTRYESAVIDRAGRRIPVEFIVRTMQRDGERQRMTVIRDLRDRDAARTHIERLAQHDELTGLPNRRAFMRSIEARLEAARAAGEPLALLVIDLDHFRRINDSLGHGIGDAVLQRVAECIRAVLRASDEVARFGGDEFMVLVGGGPQRADVADVAAKLLEAIGRPLMVAGAPTVSLMPSIGIAMFPGDGASPAELIRHADTAMYRAKARGRATTQFFEPALASDAYAALVLEDELGRALERGEFELHYQPQVRARDGVLVGAEALIRWRHPQRGLLAPAHFIGLAEEQRLMQPIGAWVLREAAAAARRWRDAGARALPVAVNLSARQFQGDGFVDSVADALERSGLPGHLLELELTERMLMNELADVSPKLAELKSLGIRLSVDDFGTGYSSLGQLKSLPIDKMKIDRSFVSDLPEARDSVAIARAVIQMGRSLGIAVIAEGVETPAQRDFLAGERCDELQGFAISQPLPAAAFDDWVAQRH